MMTFSRPRFVFSRMVRGLVAGVCGAGLAAGGSLGAGTLTYIGPGGTTTAPKTGNWSAAANWNEGTAPAVSPADATLDLSFANGGSGAANYTATHDLGGTLTLNDLSLSVSTGATTITLAASAAASNLLFVDNAGDAPSITNTRVDSGAANLINIDIELNTNLSILQSGTGPLQIGNVTAPAANTFNLNGNTLTFGGTSTGTAQFGGRDNLSAITGTGAVAINRTNSTSTVALAGQSTYSGGTTLTQGLLAFVSNSTGSAGAVTSGPIGTGSLTVNGGAMRSTATGDTTVGNAIILNAGFTVPPATNAKSLTLSGPITVNGTRTLTFDTTTVGSQTVFSGALGGTGNITKAGAGQVTFSSADSNFSGGLLIGNSTNVGVTLLGASSTGAPGAVTKGPVGTGTLTLRGTTGTTLASTSATARTINNAIVFAGTAVNVSFGQATGGTGALTFGGTVDLGAGDRTVTINNASTTLGGAISGTTTQGALTKAGTGRLTLSGANTYAGATTINGGTLEVANDGTTTAGFITGSAAANSIAVASTATLQLSGSASVTERLGNTAGMTLSGGKFDLNNLSEGAAGSTGVGALTLMGSSTVDFGTLGGGDNVIQFASIGGVADLNDNIVLQITDWNGTAFVGGAGDRLLFAGVVSDFETRFAQTEVSFNGIGGYAAVPFGGYYEITAVPEPGAAFLVVLGLGAVLGRRAQRRVA